MGPLLTTVTGLALPPVNASMPSANRLAVAMGPLLLIVIGDVFPVVGGVDTVGTYGNESAREGVGRGYRMVVVDG
jgi:hypothetical protein